MCEITKEIKFCTCNATELEKPDWKLTRAANLFSMSSFILGSYMTSDKDLQDDKLRAEILEKLKNNTLFDIENYQPQEEDVLEVFDLAVYRYINNKWITESTYHPFGDSISIFKTDKSEILVGKIDEK